MLRALPAAALLATTACATASPEQAAPAFAGDSAVYACADGRRLDVLYGGDAAVLTIGGETVQMTTARSASGARYVGGGWQWWARGSRDGTLTRLGPGEEIATAPGTACRAR